MPVSPKECIKHLDQIDKRELDNLQSTIDATLLKSYHGQGSTTVTIYQSINDRLKKKLKENYKNAGWSDMTFKTDYCNDPRDPSTSTTITLTAGGFPDFYDR